MAEPIGARLRLCVFGRLRVLHPDGTETIPSGPRPRQLLLFLALHGGHAHTDHAVEALWPDNTIHEGRTRLRNVLTRVRDQCGHLITREGDTLRLNADTDLAELEQAAATLLTLTGQTLAPDAYYAEWAEHTRRRLHLLQDTFNLR
jgi:DNA-binding SARP family transcriptional activator